MKDLIKFDHSKGTLAETLGIAEDRVDDLWKKSLVSLWELQHPDAPEFTESNVIEAFVKHGETPKEILLQGFAAANYIRVNFESSMEIFENE